MPNTATATIEQAVCAGGCGQPLAPSEVRNGQKTKRGHSGGKCPGPPKAAAVTPPPVVPTPCSGPAPKVKDVSGDTPPRVIPVTRFKDETTGLELTEKGPEETKPAKPAKARPPRYRHEQVLNALRGLHIVPQMTCPAFSGEGNHVRLEALHMGDDDLAALKEFLGHQE